MIAGLAALSASRAFLAAGAVARAVQWLDTAVARADALGRPEFAAAVRATLGLADWHQVELHTPFITRTKTDIVRRGAELGVDFAATWSCCASMPRACHIPCTSKPPTAITFRTCTVSWRRAPCWMRACCPCPSTVTPRFSDTKRSCAFHFDVGPARTHRAATTIIVANKI